jgi:hypothetical protein
MLNQKGFGYLYIVLGIIALIIIGYIVNLLIRYNNDVRLNEEKDRDYQQYLQDTASPSATASASPTSQSNSYDTYTNEEYGYSIKYPSEWTAGDGWFTAPGGQPGYGYSNVSIRISEKINNFDNKTRDTDSLEEYVKKDAGFETGPPRDLLNINKIVTDSGVVGYKVAWKASPWSADKKTYTTFFELPGNKSSTIQIEGREGDHMEIYDSMLLTFSYTK